MATKRKIICSQFYTKFKSCNVSLRDCSHDSARSQESWCCFPECWQFSPTSSMIRVQLIHALYYTMVPINVCDSALLLCTQEKIYTPRHPQIKVLLCVKILQDSATPGQQAAAETAIHRSTWAFGTRFTGSGAATCERRGRPIPSWCWLFAVQRRAAWHYWILDRTDDYSIYSFFSPSLSFYIAWWVYVCRILSVPFSVVGCEASNSTYFYTPSVVNRQPTNVQCQCFNAKVVIIMYVLR